MNPTDRTCLVSHAGGYVGEQVFLSHNKTVGLTSFLDKQQVSLLNLSHEKVQKCNYDVVKPTHFSPFSYFGAKVANVF
jgi:hypothetical protein